jgi:hypothetical protein
LSTVEHQGQVFPLALLELRRDRPVEFFAKLVGEHRGQFKLEAAQDLGVVFVGKDKRRSAFLVRAPDERAALADAVEGIGAGHARGGKCD